VEGEPVAETNAGRSEEFDRGRVKGVGHYAVGVSNGTPFAVSRRCRHLVADLAGGRVNAKGQMLCPWHGAAYDVTTGHMVRGPQGIFAKVPGLDRLSTALTRLIPLRRARVTEHDGCLFLK
jgi:nitrite reductase/ring-hydroxylating ferredoxin subunit